MSVEEEFRPCINMFMETGKEAITDTDEAATLTEEDLNASTINA